MTLETHYLAERRKWRVCGRLKLSCAASEKTAFCLFFMNNIQKFKKRFLHH